MDKIKTVNKYAFFDESGTGGDNIYLALGVLVCSKPSELHEQLDKVRKQYHYYNEIKFEKMSSKRFDICQEFLQVFASSNDIFFKAVLINKKGVRIEHFQYKKWVRFNVVADDLINSVLSGRESAKIFADEKTSPAEDNFSDYLLTHVIGAQEVVIVDSKDYDLIQLCDLLLGAVRAKYENVVKSALKKQIIKKVFSFPKSKLDYYEYSVKKGQPSESESGLI